MREQGPLVLLLVGVLLISWGSAAKGDIDSDPSNCKTLSDSLGYRVCWKVQDNEIHLKLRIEAEGRWIGFGLGEPTSGSMPGSDIVTMMIDNTDQPVVIDRNAMGFFLPEQDKCQDWQFVSATVTHGDQPTTSFTIKRLLDTQDTQDRPITPGLNKIVWAVGRSTSLSYHGSSRGSDAIDFLGTEPEDNNSTQGAATFEFRMPNVTVPAQKTTYMCQSFSLPQVDDAHIIVIEPLIDQHGISKDFVHHFLVHVCEPGINGTGKPTYWDRYQQPGQCFSPLGDLSTGCISLLYVWAVGSNALVLPKEAGFRMGNKSSYGVRHAILEVHYDNPQITANITDNSGIRIYYTSKLRPNDAGVMTIGDIVTQFAPIPPLLQPYALGSYYQANCPAECTSSWDHDINVFADGLHMHQAGHAIWSTHWDENNEYLGLFNTINFYQFDFQQITFLNKTIRRGDRINLSCVYDTSTRTSPTKFSIGSEDEMCMEFIFYYPILFASPAQDTPYVFCGYIRGSTNNMTWCGDYNSQTALRPELQNPSVWDPLSLGDSSFGQEAPFCKAYGDGSGGGDDDLGFWPGFLVGGAVVIGALFLISLAALIGLVYYHRRRSAYEQL